VTTIDAELLAQRIAALRARIAQAAAAIDRDPAGVRIVAVTKTHPVEVARAAVAAGLVDLGENRVDELVAKSSEVEARWHLVGQLQRNKVRQVVGRAALIHSVDRRSLVEALSRHAEASGVVQDVLLQVNVGEDPAKGGCSLAELPDLVAYAAGSPGLRVVGLMTVPPLPGEGVAPADAARPLFRALREARDRLRPEHPGLEELSMGMSDDLEAAVQEHATMVRVGSALFGAREEVAR
jgi:pyridoxal phosphate enzyme (YggS family)